MTCAAVPLSAAALLLTLSVSLHAQPAPSGPAPVTRSPATRDARRFYLLIRPGRLTLVSQRDDGAARAVPEQPRVTFMGRKLTLRRTTTRRYTGEIPGTERRFETTLPPLRKPGLLELLDPAPAASEPARITLSIAAPVCLTDATGGRMLPASADVQAVGEIFPAPGAPLRLTLAPMQDRCAAPALPPPSGTRMDSHVNHAPRHDGVFFMAEDGFHHLEGVCRCGAVSAYLYDDRVLPLPSLAAEGRLRYTDGVVTPLAPDPAGETLTARLPAGAQPPLDVILFARLAPGLGEARFDFHFKFCDPCAP